MRSSDRAGRRVDAQDVVGARRGEPEGVIAAAIAAGMAFSASACVDARGGRRERDGRLCAAGVGSRARRRLAGRAADGAARRAPRARRRRAPMPRAGAGARAAAVPIAPRAGAPLSCWRIRRSSSREPRPRIEARARRPAAAARAARPPAHRVPTRAIEGEHQLRDQALSQRVLAHQLLQLGHETRALAAREVGVDALLSTASGRRSLELSADQPGGDQSYCRSASAGAAPEGECFAQDVRRLCRCRRKRSARRARATSASKRSRSSSPGSTRSRCPAPADDAARPQQGPQAREVAVERATRGAGGGSPQTASSRRSRATGSFAWSRSIGEHGALLRPAQGQRPAVDEHCQRTEEPELHPPSKPRLQGKFHSAATGVEDDRHGQSTRRSGVMPAVPRTVLAALPPSR